MKKIRRLISYQHMEELMDVIHDYWPEYECRIMPLKDFDEYLENVHLEGIFAGLVVHED